MPLCTIVTKWPEPPGPSQSQHGVPSGATAAMPLSMFSTCGHADGSPPGISDGPWRAPSSPPEIPTPRYLIPSMASRSARRVVSVYREFPPSMTMSLGSRRGRRSSITASTGEPAFTMRRTFRGWDKDWTRSGRVVAAMMSLFAASRVMNSSVTDVVRL